MWYNLTQVAEAADVQKRTVQFWSSEGALKPQPGTANQGPGRGRLYDATEVEIAAILGWLARYSVKIGPLKGIAALLRQVLSTGPRFGISKSQDAEAAHILYTLKDMPDEVKKEYATVIAKAPRLDLDEQSARDLSWYAKIARAREGEAIWLNVHIDDSDNWALAFSHDRPMAGGSGDDWPHFIAVSVTTLLRRVWA